MTKPTMTPLITAAVLCEASGRASAQEPGFYADPLAGGHSHSNSWRPDCTDGIGYRF
jgi:hypothetical protein